MEYGKRPGGLTALAIINFLFAAGAAITVLTLAAGYLIALNVTADSSVPIDDAARQKLERMKECGPALFSIAGLSALEGLFGLLAGIGYLQQKQVLGRGVGNTYAIVASAVALTSANLLPPDIGGGFSLGTILGLLYPVLTFVLLNGTFKHDFIR